MQHKYTKTGKSNTNIANTATYQLVLAVFEEARAFIDLNGPVLFDLLSEGCSQHAFEDSKEVLRNNKMAVLSLATVIL